MEYIYKNKADTKRFKIFDVEDYYCEKSKTAYWDVDIWEAPNNVWTFSIETGEGFSTKRDAKTWIEENYGKIISINIDSVIDGWKIGGTK